MKLIFISPYYSNIWEPIGIGYIASYIKKYFKEKIDMEYYSFNFDYSSEVLDACQSADIVLFSATTPTIEDVILFSELVKEQNSKVKTIIGGWHATTVPEELMDKFDHIVVGEGESAVLRILNGETDKVVYGERLSFVPLIWPDRKLIKQERTLDLCQEMCGERIASFQSHRGCPMNCVFCAESCMSGVYDREINPIRVRNVFDLLGEIEYVYNTYNITSFKFVDPTWCYPKNWVDSFCAAKVLCDSKIRDLPWEAMLHAAFIDKHMLELMSLAGCKQINVGCESGSQKILNDIHKGVTVKKIKRVFKEGKELGISMRAFFIIGMPNETIDDITETISLIYDINPDVVGVTILCPYPGTKFYDPVKYSDVLWSAADEYSNDFWSTKHFSNKDLHKIQEFISGLFLEKVPHHQKEIMGL